MKQKVHLNQFKTSRCNLIQNIKDQKLEVQKVRVDDQQCLMKIKTNQKNLQTLKKTLSQKLKTSIENHEEKIPLLLWPNQYLIDGITIQKMLNFIILQSSLKSNQEIEEETINQLIERLMEVFNNIDYHQLQENEDGFLIRAQEIVPVFCHWELHNQIQKQNKYKCQEFIEREGLVPIYHVEQINSRDMRYPIQDLQNEEIKKVWNEIKFYNDKSSVFDIEDIKHLIQVRTKDDDSLSAIIVQIVDQEGIDSSYHNKLKCQNLSQITYQLTLDNNKRVQVKSNLNEIMVKIMKDNYKLIEDITSRGWELECRADQYSTLLVQCRDNLSLTIAMLEFYAYLFHCWIHVYDIKHGFTHITPAGLQTQDKEILKLHQDFFINVAESQHKLTPRTWFFISTYIKQSNGNYRKKIEPLIHRKKDDKDDIEGNKWQRMISLSNDAVIHRVAWKLTLSNLTPKQQKLKFDKKRKDFVNTSAQSTIPIHSSIFEDSIMNMFRLKSLEDKSVLTKYLNENNFDNVIKNVNTLIQSKIDNDNILNHKKKILKWKANVLPIIDLKPSYPEIKIIPHKTNQKLTSWQIQRSECRSKFQAWSSSISVQSSQLSIDYEKQQDQETQTEEEE